MGVAETGVLKSGGVPGGSVQYVALSDIKSGKVKVPEGTQLPPPRGAREPLQAESGAGRVTSRMLGGFKVQYAAISVCICLRKYPILK